MTPDQPSPAPTNQAFAALLAHDAAAAPRFPAAAPSRQERQRLFEAVARSGPLHGKAATVPRWTDTAPDAAAEG